MKKWRLNRTVQCDKCPWKVSTNPHEIPDGYSVELHENIRDTIAEPGVVSDLKTLRIMACHETGEDACIGWLHNQLGRGNNLPLRIHMVHCANTKDIQVIGEQHPDFESTLPTQRKKEHE